MDQLTTPPAALLELITRPLRAHSEDKDAALMRSLEWDRYSFGGRPKDRAFVGLKSAEIYVEPCTVADPMAADERRFYSSPQGNRSWSGD